MDACSTFVLMMCIPALLFAMAVPMRAMLLDSEPPEVNKISLSATFQSLCNDASGIPDIVLRFHSPDVLGRRIGVIHRHGSGHNIHNAAVRSTLVVAELSKYASISFIPPQN